MNSFTADRSAHVGQPICHPCAIGSSHGFRIQDLRPEGLGVVNRLCDSPAAARESARDLARTIAQRAPLSVQSIKAEIAAQSSASTMNASELRRLREQAWASADFREGRAAFVERRPANFRGE